VGVGALASLLGGAAGCSPPPNAEDVKRIEALRVQYGQRYQFEFDPPNYLRVTSQTDTPPSIEDLREIFKSFVMINDRTPRLDTDYLHVNAYDREGAFQRQLYWDAQAKQIAESRTEYY
jgi:hypothetical protein